MDIAGKTAVITGGASGIGLGIAERLGRAGARIALADIDSDALDRARSLLEGTGAEVLVCQTDVTDPSSVESLAEAVSDRYGATQLLINNAGVTLKGAIWELRLEDWHWVHGVCFWGAVHSIRSFVPGMIARSEKGHIVNVSSMAGLLTRGGSGPYDTAKQALVGLTESLALELADAAPHLGVSLFCPGYVATNIGESSRHRPARFGETTEVRARSSSPAKRQSPADAAELVCACIRHGRYAGYMDWEDWRPVVEHRFLAILDQRQPERPVFP